MATVTLAEMVRNGTMSAELAATLWGAVEEEQSFLTVAIPRFAGKSTTSYAALALRRPETRLHHFGGEPGVLEQLRRDRLGGYIVVPEFSQAPVPGYIWGEPVRQVIATAVEAGYALQAALHAPGVVEGMREVTFGNRVSDGHAGIFKLIMYIELYGTDPSNFWRRIAELYEVDGVEKGLPVGRTLFRWHKESDVFEQIAEPRQFGRDRVLFQARANLLADLAASGQTSEEQVAAAVANFRRSG